MCLQDVQVCVVSLALVVDDDLSHISCVIVILYLHNHSLPLPLRYVYTGEHAWLFTVVIANKHTSRPESYLVSSHP